MTAFETRLIARSRTSVFEARTEAALAAAKARGQALGNPRLAEARAIANAAHKAEADAHAASVAPLIASWRSAN